MSGSILYSARVIWHSATGPSSQMKPSGNCFSFVDQPVSVISSPLSNGDKSILYVHFEICSTLSIHYFGV